MLLHPTSLPGPWEAGVLGPDAYRFIDWLAAAGFSVWQMLPIGPVGDSLSPYQSTSAFAGNRRLVEPGPGDAGEAEQGASWPVRRARLGVAARRLVEHVPREQRPGFLEFWRQQRDWLLPYALFRVCRQQFGSQGWWTWPPEIRERQPAALARLLAQQADALHAIVAEQYLFDRQWMALKAHAARRGVRLFGDVPIYADLDSADVWWHRAAFRVDESGQPEAVAGVPPDYFSADGQVWGNPLYAWDRLAADGFRWWIARLRCQLRRFDLLRLDHFRGLVAFWEVPAGAAHARGGRWRTAPGAALLEAAGSALGQLPLVAEDLGTITPEVHALRARFGLPGMLVMQFAFDGSPDNPYLPVRHGVDSVVYAGTHDNDTLIGWSGGLDAATRRRVSDVLQAQPDEIPTAMIRAVCHSPARLAVLTMQDLLGLGADARMNRPGVGDGNWRWRFRWEDLSPDLAARCRDWLGSGDRLVG